MYKLLIEDDEGGQTAVSLIRDEITIGRKEGNTIRLTDRNVSRRHGRIVREDDRIYVEDVAARYGIEKNGSPVDDRSELQEGDVIAIGDYQLTLQLDSDAKQKKKEQQEAEKAKKEPPERPEGAVDDDFSDDEREQTQVIQTLPAKLVVVSSNFAGEEFPLTEDEMIIGRGESCHIIIDHRSVSGKHAKVIREGPETYKIVDLNSSNGVKINDEQYRALQLKRGDMVELGHVKFRFVEPGENYVFTPESAEPSPKAAPSPDSGGPDMMKLGLVGGGLVAMMVVLSGVGMLVLGNSDDDGDEVTTAEEQLDDEVEVDEGQDEVEARIDDARDRIAEGDLSETIGQLEAMLDHLETTSEQRDEIEDLIDLARHERANNKDYYEDAVDELEEGNPLAAFNAMAAIPPETVFYELMNDDGTADEIHEAVLDKGQKAMEEDDLETARRVADELVLADYDPALEFSEAVEARDEQLEEEAVATAQQEETSVAQVPDDDPGSGGPPTGGSPPTEEPDPPPPPQEDPSPGLSSEEARDKYTEAGRHLTGGSPQDAIDTCRQALNAGHTPCHRIMGLAHARMGDNDGACRHFDQYLATNPDNPDAVMGQMDNLGCD